MISLNRLTVDAYRALRYAIIKAAEAEILRPYPDSIGLPTIGLGLDLRPVRLCQCGVRVRRETGEE
jgi:hypothetical protein